ncbi:MAG: glycosyltransferase [Bacteroidota bacterium]
MTNAPLVTVICLCYNHEDYVVSALDSVINQTYISIELIIVDDNSHDNSARIIEEWNRDHGFTFIKNTSNLGATKAFNKGYTSAKGEYIVDLAADDLLTEDSIEKRVNTFLTSKLPRLGVVYSNIESIDEYGNHIENRYPTDNHGKALETPPVGDVYEIHANRYFISAPSMLMKKEVLDRMGGYDESLDYEDFDFWIRSSRDYNYDYTDAVLVKKRILKDSLGKQFYTKKGPNLGRSTLKVCKKIFRLNRTKSEHIALKDRLYYELKLNTKILNIGVALGFLVLMIRLRLKIMSL